jgi:rhodanese-related sulfurtransferase
MIVFGKQLMGLIEVEELARRLAEIDSSLQLIDVREPEEIEIASLPNFTVLSLSKFGEWSETIKTKFNPDVETLVMCHHGMRSAQMCQWLMSVGFTKVKNIAGGIDAYSSLVDRSIPRY